MELILTISGTVDDKTEGTAIRQAVDTALIPFEELELTVNSKVIQTIPIP